MRQSNLHSLGFEYSIAPVTKGAGLTGDTTEGTAIDLAGFESCTFLFILGLIAHADTTGTFKLQDCDDNATWVDVTAATYEIGSDTISSLVVADSSKIRKIGYIGTKRYVRAYLTLTTGASTGSFPYAVIAVKGNARVGQVASS